MLGRAVALALVALWGAAGKLMLDTDVNGVMETPVVECLSERIQMSLKTKGSFRGRIYLKGSSKREECVSDFSTFDAPDDRDFSVAIDYNLCNTERIRSLSPNGVTYANTVVVQFHDKFITKGDKAYHIRCFYSQLEKTVSSAFDVSGIPTGSLDYDMKMPQCEYTVRKGSSNGPLVRAAEVGEEVFHRWECTGDMDAFGMLVHSCWVEGRDGEREEMVDEAGCALQPRLLPALAYNDQLSLAYAQAHVFKYPDNSFIHFRCQIRVCTKLDASCRAMSPPSCGSRAEKLEASRDMGEGLEVARDEEAEEEAAGRRRKRQMSRLSIGGGGQGGSLLTSRLRRSLVEAGLAGRTLDVVTGEILVVEEGEGDGKDALPTADPSNDLSLRRRLPQHCLSRAALFLFFSGFLAFFSLSAALVIFLVVKKREKSALDSFVDSHHSLPPVLK